MTPPVGSKVRSVTLLSTVTPASESMAAPESSVSADGVIMLKKRP